MSIKFLKMGKVKNPIRDASENQGIDFFVPEFTKQFDEDLKARTITHNQSYIIIPPHSSINFPSYIKVNLLEHKKDGNKLCLLAVNKSGVASKKGLQIGACLIDSSYTGVIHINLINSTDYDQVIEYGTKCIQLIPIWVPDDEIEILEIPEDKFYNGVVSKRGDGGFGSTGLN